MQQRAAVGTFVVQEERNQLDGKMMQNVRSARRDADILLALVDASDDPEQGLDLLQLSSDHSTSRLPVGVVCTASTNGLGNVPVTQKPSAKSLYRKTVHSIACGLSIGRLC